MAELLGTHSYQLDPKGRVSLPGRFREAFADGTWLTVGQDGCLFAFPRAEWERRADEIGASPLSDATGRAYARMFFGGAEEAKLDSQGRLDDPPAAPGCRRDPLGGRGPGRPGADGDLGPRVLRALPGRVRRRVSGRVPRTREVTSVEPRGKLASEVRQSLSLIGMTALTLLASIGFGLLVGRAG